jgi:cold shock CspA family protein
LDTNLSQNEIASSSPLSVEESTLESEDRRGDGNIYRLQPTQDFETEPRLIETQSVAPSDASIYSVVKWFNAERGFGFVELSDGSGDAFLHESVLARSGIDTLGPGAVVEARVAVGHKGPQVTEILSADLSSAVLTTQRRSSFGEARSSEPDSEVSVEEWAP